MLIGFSFVAISPIFVEYITLPAAQCNISSKHIHVCHKWQYLSICIFAFLSFCTFVYFELCICVQIEARRYMSAVTRALFVANCGVAPWPSRANFSGNLQKRGNKPAALIHFCIIIFSSLLLLFGYIALNAWWAKKKTGQNQDCS